MTDVTKEVQPEPSAPPAPNEGIIATPVPIVPIVQKTSFMTYVIGAAKGVYYSTRVARFLSRMAAAAVVVKVIGLTKYSALGVALILL